MNRTTLRKPMRMRIGAVGAFCLLILVGCAVTEEQRFPFLSWRYGACRPA